MVNSRGAANPYVLSWDLPDPAAVLNYLQIDVRDLNVAGQAADSVRFTLTDLNGTALSGSQYQFTADNQYLNFYLTDPSAFANGFVLNGTIDLIGGDLTARSGEKNELVEIKFGNTPSLSVPDGGATVGLLGAGLAGLGLVRRRRIA